LSFSKDCENEQWVHREFEKRNRTGHKLQGYPTTQ
jgi:hypothetical protein